ncbi:MAG: FecR domain-containing protein [Desulfovibrionaceae bacterium]
MNRLITLALLSALLFAGFLSSAHAAERVGKVQSYKGVAAAVSDGKKRTLSLNDDLFSNDLIVTGSNSFLQVMFEDGTVLALDEYSEILLRDVVYSPGAAGRAGFNIDMIAGTCRFVTGQITKHNPEKFKVGSPLGTIGIRGTEGGVLADMGNRQAFNADLDANINAPGAHWSPAVNPDVLTQTIAHFAGSANKPISFSDRFGKTVDIPRGQALDVSAIAGAGAARGISEQDKRNFKAADFSTSVSVPSAYRGIFEGFSSTPGNTGGIVGGGGGGENSAGPAAGGSSDSGGQSGHGGSTSGP